MHEVWFRNPRQVIKNILATTDFDGHIDYAAYREFSDNKRQYCNLMSGNWSWRQSVRAHPQHIFARLQIPLFRTLLLGILQHTAQCSSRSSWGPTKQQFLSLLARMTSIPYTFRSEMFKTISGARTRMGSFYLDFSQYQKVCILYLYPPFITAHFRATGARKDTDNEEFRNFKRDLIHRSVATILLPLKPFMTTPDIVLCADRYFRRAIYGLGPHISNYLEQISLTWLIYGWCPT